MSTTELEGKRTRISTVKSKKNKPAEIFIKRIEAGLICFGKNFFD